MRYKKNTQKKPAVAAFLSLIFWGSGQFYNGQFLKGCLFIFTNILILPWMYSIFDAYVTCQRHNRGEIKQQQPRRWYVAMLVWFFMSGVFILLLMWVWTWVIQQNRYDYNILAKNFLLEVAVGSEQYARDHDQNYPSTVKQLINSNPPYLQRNLCQRANFGFEYSCYFHRIGYRIEAKPIKGLSNKELQKHTIVTGGIFLDQNKME